MPSNFSAPFFSSWLARTCFLWPGEYKLGEDQCNYVDVGKPRIRIGAYTLRSVLPNADIWSLWCRLQELASSASQTSEENQPSASVQFTTDRAVVIAKGRGLYVRLLEAPPGSRPPRCCFAAKVCFPLSVEASRACLFNAPAGASEYVATLFN